MMDWVAVICALITGLCSLIGVVISNNRSNAKIQSKIETNQAVTNCEIKELTREVREHNNFAKRIPVTENDIEHLKCEINAINHRLDILDKKVN